MEDVVLCCGLVVEAVRGSLRTDAGEVVVVGTRVVAVVVMMMMMNADVLVGSVIGGRVGQGYSQCDGCAPSLVFDIPKQRPKSKSLR